MRLLTAALVIALSVSCATAQTFNDFINSLYPLTPEQKAAKIDSFMNAADRFPYIDQDSLCHYIYRGTATSVQVAGDVTDWAVGFSLQHVADTDFWFANKYYEMDARLDYKYVIDGSNWILDPLNPHLCYGGYGPNSELRMPGYEYPDEVDYISEHPGTVETFYLASDTLTYGNPRQYKVYLPNGYDPEGAARYPLILAHDGTDYLTLAKMARVLDYLIDNQRIEPVIGLFVPPASSDVRTFEYGTTHRDEYIDFIANELIPHIDSTFCTDPRRERRATVGDSYGGNISLQLAATHPELFGHAAGQSPFVSKELQELLDVDLTTENPIDSLDVWVDIGTYDIGLLEMQVADTLIPILQNRGYNYSLTTMHEGHSWGNWRKNLQPILKRFFPGVNVSTPEIQQGMMPRDFQLLPNHPNPFNGTTMLSFQMNRKSWARLSVLDLLGRQVAVLGEEQFSPGHHTISFNASSLASGSYIAMLETAGQREARRITLIK